jgi:SAM-dependent methyltransferase
MKDQLAKQEQYYGLGEDYFWFRGHNAVVEEQVAAHLDRAARGSSRTLRLVDVGCGPGNTIRRFSRWGRVLGIDYSLDALAFARRKGVTDVASADVTALPIASAAADGVLALEVLEHVEDDRAALREIARILRPGGIVAITVPAFMSLWRHHDEAYGHCRRYTKRELADRASSAGLEVISCQYFKCAFFLPMWTMAAWERAGFPNRRDSYVTVPSWLNRALAAEIVWEARSGLARHAPFGSALLCVGRRRER